MKKIVPNIDKQDFAIELFNLIWNREGTSPNEILNLLRAWAITTKHPGIIKIFNNNGVFEYNEEDMDGYRIVTSLLEAEYKDFADLKSKLNDSLIVITGIKEQREKCNNIEWAASYTLLITLFGVVLSISQYFASGASGYPTLAGLFMLVGAGSYEFMRRSHLKKKLMLDHLAFSLFEKL